MPAIHLIKKSNGGLPQIVPVLGEANAFTSGFWTLSEEKARSLIGGQIYFHDSAIEHHWPGMPEPGH
jgi:hypothetical protein